MSNFEVFKSIDELNSQNSVFKSYSIYISKMKQA